MEDWQCCRMCLGVQNLNLIFLMPEHSEKYSEVIFNATGIKVGLNDSLPQQMCSPCISTINTTHKFKKKCEESQKVLLERLNQKPNLIIKIEPSILNNDEINEIDISEFLENDFREFDDNIALSEYSLQIEKRITEKANESETKITAEPVEKKQEENDKNTHVENKSKAKRKPPKDSVKKRGRTKKENQEEKRTKQKKERVKEEIECELCHKILTSKLSLRNHNKIHTGFDVVCEHCGKKFITRRLLLMHCKAKHGYEKTDKCSFCDYKASNAEQVKIHERLHTGEKPYSCAVCGTGFHRRSSYLQHVAIHLPEKTVQCDQCPARFKSATLMRIHRNRHRGPQYSYRCRLCGGSFARRRNVARHLLRVHALHAHNDHIDRTKCV